MSELNMYVSGIINRENQKKACVRFEDKERFAEGFIPDCKIEKQNGFNEDEIEQLENYMKDNLEALKNRAAGVDPILSMIREK